MSHRPFYSSAWFWVLILSIICFILFFVAYEVFFSSSGLLAAIFANKGIAAPTPWWVWLMFLIPIILFILAVFFYLSARMKHGYQATRGEGPCAAAKPVPQRPARLGAPACPTNGAVPVPGMAMGPGSVAGMAMGPGSVTGMAMGPGASAANMSRRSIALQVLTPYVWLPCHQLHLLGLYDS